jgi:hypothetical protein
MFVVTAISAWLIWEIGHIRERRAFLRHADTLLESVPIVKNRPETASIPFWRRCLGDRAETVVLLPLDADDSDWQKAKVLFPEAEILAVPLPIKRQPSTH